jgi:hypothetical protein
MSEQAVVAGIGDARLAVAGIGDPGREKKINRRKRR